jgi:hypothetical protein
MSQRESGYQRKLLDQYETPAWVTRALIPHLPEFTGKVREPACGSGKMVAALRQAGFDVAGRDITQGVDFLGQTPETGVNAIITNPPYALAREFIERALHFDDTRIVAMLLRTDFDHAASRAHLFAHCDVCQKGRADQAHPMVRGFKWIAIIQSLLDDLGPAASRPANPSLC